MEVEVPERAIVLSRKGAQLQIGRKYTTSKIIGELFDLSASEKDIVLLDPDGEEVECRDGYFSLDPTKYYTAVTEQDLEEEEDTEPSYEEKREHVYKVEQIRRQFLFREWHPLYPWLYTLSDRHMNPSFVKLVKDFYENNDPRKLTEYPKKLTETGIYHVGTLFSEEFCRNLIEEVDAIENSGLPLIRPNSMNRYGAVLSEFGLDKVWQDLMSVYLRPLLNILYPDFGPYIDQHHAFIVQYKPEEQQGLGLHYDDSEVTLNLCLGKKFEGGALHFEGLLSKPEQNEQYLYHHETGAAIFHRGEHRHGALPVTSGSRYNLIIWYRCTKMREGHLCG